MTRPDILHKIAQTALRVRMLEKELAPSVQPRRVLDDLNAARQELDRLLKEWRESDR